MPIRNAASKIVGVSQLINKLNRTPFNKNDEYLFEVKKFLYYVFSKKHWEEIFNAYFNSSFVLTKFKIFEKNICNLTFSEG